MAVCYNKLWKLLIDKRMTKTQLCKKAKVSTNAIAKMGRDEDVRVEVLARICEALDCSIEDIIELIPNPDNTAGKTSEYPDKKQEEKYAEHQQDR